MAAKITLNSRYGSGTIRHGETAQKGLNRNRRSIQERWGNQDPRAVVDPKDYAVGAVYQWGDPTVKPEGWRAPEYLGDREYAEFWPVARGAGGWSSGHG